MFIDYNKKPYNIYRRYRMFKTKKKLFLIQRGKRKKYCLTPTIELAMKKYKSKNTFWSFIGLPRFYIFFVDVFNYKDSVIDDSNRDYYNNLAPNQKYSFTKKLRKEKYA